MSKVTYKVLPFEVTDKQAFIEASAEELRVLIALAECGGECEVGELAKMAGTSAARTRASLVLWEEEGVIKRRDGNIVEEFPSRDDLSERKAQTVAKSIRDNNLELLLTEIAGLLGKAALNTIEIKNIEEAYTTLGVSSEYLTVLAAHMLSEQEAKGKSLTTVMIRNKARDLVEKEYDTVEELEKYIENCTRDSETERAIREIMGCYGRKFSPTEKEHFKRWTEEYGFGTEIIGAAYDITVVNTQRAHIKYMDKILTSWHDAGCKTVAECKAHSFNSGNADKGNSPRKKKTEAPTPKYGSFDANEAFLAALDRSFSDGEN